MSGLGFMFVGPDTITGCPKKLWITIVGDMTIGVGDVFLFVPILPELI